MKKRKPCARCNVGLNLNNLLDKTGNLATFTACACLWVLIACTACGDLEKEIDVNLDNYDRRLVVECYLLEGKPYQLLLSNSAAFFEPIDIDPEMPLHTFTRQLEENAVVRIIHVDDTIVLQNQLTFDPSSGQVFNYISAERIPESEEPFELFVETADGRTATATTAFLPAFGIDSVVTEFSPENDTFARTLLYYTDDMSQTNYVRRLQQFGGPDSITQDFVTDDRFFDSPTVTFGTGYEYATGDTIIDYLYTIEQAYYDFFVSVQQANQANGSPFSQPGRIISNVSGTGDPLGIFTALSFDKRVTVISR